MTVEELLFSSIMNGATVIAGKEGMNRSVTWCALDNVIDFENWVMPGTMIMHTGMNDGGTTEAYVKYMHEQEASGILLLRKGDMTSDETIALCDAYNLPLIMLPYNVNIISFTRRISVLLSNDVSETYCSEEWLKELCYAENFVPDIVSAEYHGYNSEVDYFCLSINLPDIKGLNEIKMEYQILKAKHFLIKKFTWNDIKPMYFENQNQVVLFFPTGDSESSPQIRIRVREAIADLKSLYGITELSACIGSRARDIRQFVKSFRDAMRTRDLADMMGSKEEMVTYEDWGMHMHILSEPRSELKRRMESVLGELAEDKESISTLMVYFGNDESIKKTSEALFIHISTLKYRLSKIEKVLGISLSHTDDKYRVYVAVLIYGYLNLNQRDYIS